MRIILSRKGFDSASGGFPSPIFPDGRMLSIPIPAEQSPTRYEEIKWNEYDLGKIVSDLTGGRVQGFHFAHLDPDLNRESLPCLEGWLPAFGQTGSAQGHLRNCGVCEGDVFLFFGLFRAVDLKDGGLVWRKSAPYLHVIWGWLQIGEIICIDRCEKSKYSWACRHPHYGRAPDRNNTLYIAKDNLDFANARSRNPAAGIFSFFSKSLQLTDELSLGPGQWRLPAWLYPDSGKPPLSYHTNMERWVRTGKFTGLKAVDRGQEFVLNCEHYPQAMDWLCEILDN